MQNTAMVNGLVLAGGESKRMGTDKAFITYHQKEQIYHVHALLSSIGLPTYLSVNKIQSEQIKEHYEILIDEQKNAGPLAGIVTAINFNSNSPWLILGCDYPKIQRFDIQHLLYQAQKTENSVAYYMGGFYLPTIAVYKPKDFGAFNIALKNEELKLQSILKKIGCIPLEPLNIDRFVSVDSPAMAEALKKELHER